MKKLSTQPVKGFRDLYPADRAVQNWLFDTFRSVSKSYGYDEYEGPILESIDLYAAKSGQELVRQQTFQMTDRGGRKLAMRPELTPTLARMVAKKRFDLPVPIRWFSIGSRFRYEAPQKGRGREFYQMDVDLLSNQSSIADAEILSIAIEFLKSLALTPEDIVVKINNRRLVEKQLESIGIDKNKYADVIRAIDRKDKMPEDKWNNYLSDLKLLNEQIEELNKMLENKQAYLESEELSNTINILKKANLDQYVSYDPMIVRGLDYYTGTVFEARDKDGLFRAILGGGRYDNLVELFDTEPLSGIGFACGDMVLTELLRARKKLPTNLNSKKTMVLVTVFSSDLFNSSFEIVQNLRENSVSAELYPSDKEKLDKQLKYADKKNIPYAILVGPNETQNNLVTLKDLRSKSQETLPFDQVVRKLKATLQTCGEIKTSF